MPITDENQYRMLAGARKSKNGIPKRLRLTQIFGCGSAAWACRGSENNGAISWDEP